MYVQVIALISRGPRRLVLFSPQTRRPGGRRGGGGRGGRGGGGQEGAETQRLLNSTAAAIPRTEITSRPLSRAYARRETMHTNTDLWLLPPSQDEERALDKQQDRVERKRNKLKNSELLETLREEFGTTPEVRCVSFPRIICHCHSKRLLSFLTLIFVV